MAWAPDYITDQELKDFTRIDDTVDDAEIALYVTAASRAIDGHCHRQFGKLDAPAQFTYSARADHERGLWVVDIDDLQDTTGLVVEVADVGVIDASGFGLEPRNAVPKGKAYTRLAVKISSGVQPTGADGEMLVTAPWGWSAMPPQVKLAAKLQSSRFAARRDSPYGIAGSPDDGSEMRLLARVDPDVAVSLRGLVRRRRVG